MGQIQVIKNPSEAELRKLGVFDWPIWEKEESDFPWAYDAQETCYFLNGSVTVVPDGQEPVSMGTGDLVTFPSGMSCQWTIHAAVRKHYCFE